MSGANRLFDELKDLKDVDPSNPDTGDQYEYDESAGKMVLKSTLQTHIGTRNPHGTTAQDVGAVSSSSLGAINGVATLGADGRLPLSQAPSALAIGEGSGQMFWVSSS